MDFKTPFNEECFHELYIEYKESYFLSVKEFTIFWFSKVSFDSHDFRLKPSYKV